MNLIDGLGQNIPFIPGARLVCANNFDTSFPPPNPNDRIMGRSGMCLSFMCGHELHPESGMCLLDEEG